MYEHLTMTGGCAIITKEKKMFVMSTLKSTVFGFCVIEAGWLVGVLFLLLLFAFCFSLFALSFLLAHRRRSLLRILYIFFLKCLEIFVDYSQTELLHFRDRV